MRSLRCPVLRTWLEVDLDRRGPRTEVVGLFRPQPPDLKLTRAVAGFVGKGWGSG